MALQTGRLTLAVAGVSGAGKTRSLTFLLAWFAVATNLKIGVVHKENPAGRAIHAAHLPYVRGRSCPAFRAPSRQGRGGRQHGKRPL